LREPLTATRSLSLPLPTGEAIVRALARFLLPVACPPLKSSLVRVGQFPNHHLFRPAFITGLLALLCCFCVISPSAQAEPVIGQFELKTLESELGSIELQSQNAWSWGHPDRRAAVDDSELLFDENDATRRRHALEIEVGFSPAIKMRAGVEFEQERFDEPATLDQANRFDELELTEVGVELVAILTPRHGDGAGWGIVVELEHPLEDEEPDTVFLGTIFELKSGPWFAAAVPMVAHVFGGRADAGERIDRKWDFTYAAQVAYTISNDWMLAFEAYGTIERLGDSGHASESARQFGDFNQHRAGFILYRTHNFTQRLSGLGASSDDDSDDGATLTVGLGLLTGLNRNTPNHTLKLSIELDF